MLTFLVPDLVPNPEIFFGHQMGPEQTLRRETWTDRREISVRVSFIFKQTQNMFFYEPGHAKNKKNAPARNAPQQTPSNFGSKSQNLESEHSKSGAKLQIFAKSRNRNSNAILINFNYFLKIGFAAGPFAP